MIRYEHKTTYVKLIYKEKKEIKFWKFTIKSKYPSLDPEPESLCENDEYNRMLNDMGNEGWELVSTQSVTKRFTGKINEEVMRSPTVDYILIDGYLMFWKRVRE